jgi:hypothetical protein
MSSRVASCDALNAMWSKNGSGEVLFCAVLNPAPGGLTQARAWPLRKRLHKAQKQRSHLLQGGMDRRNYYLATMRIRLFLDKPTGSFDTSSQLNPPEFGLVQSQFLALV